MQNIWGIVVGVVVALTALDRVLLGVHHPSDVVAGILFGAALASSFVAAVASRCRGVDVHRGVAHALPRAAT